MLPDRRALAALAGTALLAGLLAACSDREAPSASDSPGSSTALESSPFTQTAFRVRTDTATGLNVDGGWGGLENQSVTVWADRPFRIRFEIEGPGEDPGSTAAEPATTGVRFGLQVQRNGEAWTEVLARDFPYPDEISTPRVSIVSTNAWTSGEATADLLRVAETPFVPGWGVVLDSVAPPWPETAAEGGPGPAGEAAGGPGSGGEATGRPGTPTHGEWEWPVVIRRFADGAVTNEAGDIFTFRMVDGAGRPVGGGVPATVTLSIPDGLLGGTYVETPGVLGPWQASNGDLYFPMEPAETFNVLMAVKSSNEGRSWEEVDGLNRPATDDLEGFATTLYDGRIYMLHQISEATYLHAFNTSDVADAPDRWVIQDELVSSHSEPPTQVAALVARSDGSLVASYGDSLGLRWRTRAPGGGWGEEGVVHTAPGWVASGVMAAVGADDVVHLAYTALGGGERSVWYCTLQPDGALSRPQLLATGVGLREEDIGALAPLVYIPGSDVVLALYRLADGSLNERRISADGTVTPPIRVTPRRVVQNGSDSEQVGADAVVHDGVVHVLFIDEETRDLFHIVSSSPGQWTPAVPVVEGINAQWVRGRVVVGADGDPVYGFVYDAGSDGGSGMNRYGSLPLGG
jgi:hypothetical protein